MTPNTLYQYTACPFCCKVRAGLALKGVDYDKVEVHPLNKKEIEFSSEWKKVPIWINGAGQSVVDSTKILNSLDEQYPSKPIFDSSSKETQWLEWTEKFVKSVPPAIYNSYRNAWKAFSYVTENGKFSPVQQRLIQASGAGVMRMVSKKIKKRLNISDPIAHLESQLEEWALGLEDNRFMGGEKPNAADVSMFGFCKSFDGLPAGDTFLKVPVFAKWMKAMSQETGIELKTL